MNRTALFASVAVAFVAGGTTMRLFPAANAANELTPMIVNIAELNGDAIGMPSGTGLRAKTLVSADGMTMGVQDGNVPKHMHATANEMQYILEGTGTIWLGDQEVRIKADDLVIIPKGTAHGGSKPDGRTFKAIWIKTPPQAANDSILLQ